ncbi:MAG: hypothetical protein NTW38_12900 [Candidatus Aminicenantes bacterium]|nr:hypothetical protein [Candidatus Aminicenantes bacterium]
MACPVRIFLIPILCASAASCVRLAPQTTAELPAAVLDRSVLCADVIRTDDWADLALVGTAFSKSRDASVCSVLVFKPLSGRHRLAWKWYDPSGRIVRESDAVEAGEEGIEYDRYIAWDRLPVTADMTVGRWTVAYFIDDELAGSREFDLTNETGAEVSLTGNGYKSKKPELESGRESAPGRDPKSLPGADQRST